jgi:hypothetical protein
MVFVSKLSDKDESVCRDERAAIEALSWSETPEQVEIHNSFFILGSLDM